MGLFLRNAQLILGDDVSQIVLGCVRVHFAFQELLGRFFFPLFRILLLHAHELAMIDLSLVLPQILLRFHFFLLWVPLATSAEGGLLIIGLLLEHPLGVLQLELLLLYLG